MAFKPAQRKNSKLRLALSGPSGAGKTYTAIQVAKLLGGRVALMDSERGSASKYARKPNTPEGPGNWAFDVSELEEKNVQEYISTIREAAEAGYDVLIVDSYTHSWLGALEQVDKQGGWVRAGKVVSPLVAKLVDTILSYPGHVVATMRAKTEHVIEKNDKGQTTLKKMGMASVAREGTEYEFDVMLDLALDGSINVTKTRCSDLSGRAFDRDDVPKIVAALKAWLDEGSPLTPVEEFSQRARLAASVDALKALAQEAKAALSPEDLEQLKPLFTARKTALIDEGV